MSTRLSSAPPTPTWKLKLNAPSTTVPERSSATRTAGPGRAALSALDPEPRSDPDRKTCSCAAEHAGATTVTPDSKLGPGARVVVFLLSLYKAFFSPLLPSSCKFYPTCSVYAMEAVQRHGVVRGLSLALRRLLRCRPFSPGGYDPVPDA